MTYQSEMELENLLIKQLSSQGYDKVVIANEQQLRENLRHQLFLHNKEKLNDIPFTDKEFERIMGHLEGKSVFESAKILRDKFVLVREDNTEVYIEFLNQKLWCKNKYQVTHQTTVKGKYENRYDVTILVNGLPLVQIELKRRGLDMKEAFNQVCRYKKHSYNGLFKYIQIFVISNGVDTKYFANTDINKEKKQDLMYSQTFFWSDDKNNIITQLNDFAYEFLDKCFLSEIISRYMVVSDSSKSLMVMRPYQIYAVKKAYNRVIETNKNGYIWHTTGSGKTLTSFKLSQLLAQHRGISKVFFLVDRKDLDSQTLSEFNKFEKDSVDTTDNTDTLVKQIKAINKPLIVTTIQKMANALKSPKYTKILEEYKNDKVVFIIDECHRSQFGEMHKIINKHFIYGQYIGFTGTPRFQENKSQDGRVTADIFEECLHTYLIKDAIKDGNVLGFSVDYVKTMKNKSEDDYTKVYSIDTDEALMNDRRIEIIANNIIDIHKYKTNNGKYTALFSVQSIPMLIKYYQKFKELSHDLKICAIYTYQSNEDGVNREEHSRDSLEKIMQDYNMIFRTNYDTNNFAGYFTDVSKRVKSAEIDILIVVNMFLTGFDAKTLNTLYVDKNLEYHNLLQAYSRTNRVEQATKPYGNIVCYRNLRENTDEAIKLFSQTDSTDIVLMGTYEEYLEEFKNQVNKLKKIAQTPQDVDLLERESLKAEFVKDFRELTRVLTRLKTFIEFEFTEESSGINEQEYQDYKSKYFKIYEDVKSETTPTSILNDIDFELEIMHTDRINVEYILKLIASIDLSNEKDREKKSKKIKKELDKTGDESLRLKIDLLNKFLDKVVPILDKDATIKNELYRYMETEKEIEIENFAKEINLESIDIKEFIIEQEFCGFINNERLTKVLSEKTSLGLKDRRIAKEKIKVFVRNHIKKFTY